jgi:hypothetical protein
MAHQLRLVQLPWVSISTRRSWAGSTSRSGDGVPIRAGHDFWATRGEDRGDALRADLHRMSARILSHIRGLGVVTPKTSGTPIVELQLTPERDLADVARTLWRRGVYVTLAPYGLVTP